MITRPETNKNSRNNRGRVAAWIGNGALITMLTVATTATISSAAVAQEGTALPAKSSPSKLPIEPTLRNVPQSAVPIFNRAADLLRIAQQRQRHGSPEARQSYQMAAQGFRQFLVTGGYSPNVASTDGASVAGSTITPGQVASDLRLLQNAGRQVAPQQAAILSRAAGLYASAAKNFMEGQQNASLAQSSSIRTAALNRAARANAGHRGSSQVASNSMPPMSNGRPVKVVIHGSHQDQVAARQQGLKDLTNLYAEQSATEAANQAAANQAAADQAAANQAALQQQAYMNQGWYQPYAPYGAYGVQTYNPYNPYGAGLYGSTLPLGGGTVLTSDYLLPLQFGPAPITVLPLNGNGGGNVGFPMYNSFFNFGF